MAGGYSAAVVSISQVPSGATSRALSRAFMPRGRRSAKAIAMLTQRRDPLGHLRVGKCQHGCAQLHVVEADVEVAAGRDHLREGRAHRVERHEAERVPEGAGALQVRGRQAEFLEVSEPRRVVRRQRGRRERARLEQRDGLAGGIGESHAVQAFVAEKLEVELDAERPQTRRVLAQAGLHPAERGRRYRATVQAEVQAAVRDHRIGVVPGVADRRLDETERLVERQRLRDVRAVDADFEEPAKHRALSSWRRAPAPARVTWATPPSRRGPRTRASPARA